MYKACEYRNTDEDFSEVKDFLIALETLENHDNNWDASRFDWWRYSYHYDKDQTFFSKNVQYWRDSDDKVVGLAISEYGRNDIFIVVHPQHKTLYDEIIDWCLNEFSKGKEEIYTTIFLIDSYKIQKLNESGFVKGRHDNNVRTYDLTNYECSYNLPDGYKLLSFSECMNFESKQALICDAFEKKEHSIERIKSLMSSENYISNLDLVVVKDGVCVGYCTGWIEEHDAKKGYIEPMGTHSKHRKLGIGASLAKEAFKRLRDLGVEKATIASNAEPDISNYLYDSLKPISKKSGYDFTYKLK